MLWAAWSGCPVQCTRAGGGVSSYSLDVGVGNVVRARGQLASVGWARVLSSFQYWCPKRLTRHAGYDILLVRGGKAPASQTRSGQMAKSSVAENATDNVNSEKPDRAQVAFGLPTEFKSKLDEIAAGQNKSAAALVREIVAGHYGWDLPEDGRGRHSHYASEEEKKAAQAAAQRERNELMKALMRKYRQDPSILG